MMEGSQFLPKTPESSDEPGGDERDYGGVHECDDEDEPEQDEERWCVSCAQALGAQERGPRCIECYREMREAQLKYDRSPWEKGALSPETPKKLVRAKAIKEPASCFGKKRARVNKHASDDEVDEPDLRAYFALFDNFSEIEQVKYCRAYATMLATRSVKNRVRYSKDTGEKYAKKY